MASRSHFSSTTSKSLKLKPSPKSGLIPSDLLGDILQIKNFFETFQDFLSGSEFTKEELYASLNFDGDTTLDFITEIHLDLLNILIIEIFDKNKFEDFKEEYPDEVSIFYLVKYLRENKCLDDYLSFLWPELLNQIIKFEKVSKNNDEKIKALFKNLSDASYLNYNKLEKKEKIKILLNLIDIIYETDYFREIVDKKAEEYNGFYKEKNDLIIEIKQEENALHEMEGYLSELESKNKELKSSFLTTSRQESLKKLKETENETKEMTKLQNNISKMSQGISKKKNRLEKIQKELPFYMNSMLLLGHDVNKHEYWLTISEPDKIYVRYPENPSEDIDRWYFLDTKEEIDQLLEALNTKGVREKGLYESIINNLKIETLVPIAKKDKLKEEEIMIDENSMSTSIKHENPQEKLTEILSGILTYKRNEDIEPKRYTRQKQKKTTIKKGLGYELIYDVITNSEKIFSEYLETRNCRWISSEEKQKYLEEMKNFQTIEEYSRCLLYLNENFCNIEMLYFDEESKINENDDENEEEMYYPLKDSTELKNLETDPRVLKKRISLRVWGQFNEKIKRSWMNYVTELDNLTNLYFASIVLSEFLIRYVNKKKIEQERRDPEIKTRFNEKKVLNLESYKYVSNNEQMRTKQEKMNELLDNNEDEDEDFGISLRRTRLRKKKNENLNEHQWEESCRECGEYGDVLCCDTCPSVYHLKCVGLKEVPNGKWSCYDCLQKLQSQRQTRAITKKFNIIDDN